MSKVVVFGKIPPIQGGVSARTLQFIGALRSAGHSVSVVTNARSAADGYKILFSDDDESKLQEQLNGADVLDPSDEGSIFHIPQSQAFETRLLGAGLDACKHADVIVGWYFQPYGVAAALSASLLGKRCVLMHAGSDIGRLALQPSFKTAYKQIFADSHVVSISERSRGALHPLFEQHQIVEARKGYRLPRYFNARKIDRSTTFTDLASRARANLGVWGLDRDLHTALLKAWESTDTRPLEIGIYGKLGFQKGHFDLLDAVETLGANSPVRVTFVTGGGDGALRNFARKVASSQALLENVRVCPFIPPWKIPAFIDACDAIAFLERNFEIQFHGPQVPLEVLWRGKPLICSDEIVQKQPFASGLMPWTNYVPAGDPRDVGYLADALLTLAKAQNRRDIGRAGAGLVRTTLGGARTTDNFVDTLSSEGWLN